MTWERVQSDFSTTRRQQPFSNQELKAKADDEGEVVAEATLIAVTIIGTEGLDTSVFIVFFKEEGGIVDEGVRNRVAQSSTYEYVVDALPLAFVAIGALGAMGTHSMTGDVMQRLMF